MFISLLTLFRITLLEIATTFSWISVFDVTAIQFFKLINIIFGTQKLILPLVIIISKN